MRCRGSRRAGLLDPLGGDDLLVDRDAALGRRRDLDLVHVRPRLRDDVRGDLARQRVVRESPPADGRERRRARELPGLACGRGWRSAARRGSARRRTRSRSGSRPRRTACRCRRGSRGRAPARRTGFCSAPGVPGARAGAGVGADVDADSGTSATSDPARTPPANIREHRGVATHRKSVPGPAGHVNWSVGRHLSIAPRSRHFEKKRFGLLEVADDLVARTPRRRGRRRCGGRTTARGASRRR